MEQQNENSAAENLTLVFSFIETDDISENMEEEVRHQCLYIVGNRLCKIPILEKDTMYCKRHERILEREERVCCVCYVGIPKNDPILECRHCVHRECIVKSTKPECPICRRKIRFSDEEQTRSDQYWRKYRRNELMADGTDEMFELRHFIFPEEDEIEEAWASIDPQTREIFNEIVYMHIFLSQLHEIIDAEPETSGYATPLYSSNHSAAHQD